MITAIIIDDQKDSRSALKKDIELYCPDVNVVGEAYGVKTGIDSINKHIPELVFLDIKMSDGTGFDLLEIITSERGGIDKINFKIIFTTAYEQYAINAFKYSAVDYLLKPIIPDDLKKAVEKTTTITNLSDSQKKLGALYDNIKNISRTKKIVFSTSDAFGVYNIDEIIRCEAQSNYTKFYFSNGKNILVSKTMKEYEDLLACHDFERVHISHIVNLNYIKKISKTEGGQIIMKDNTSVPLSQSKKKSLLEKLGKI